MSIPSIRHEAAVRNILAVFDQATDAEVSQGIAWYATARRECKVLAVRHNVSLDVAVGVVAALSPNNRWERNLGNADALLAAYMAGDHVESVSVSTYHAMRAKAWSVLDTTMGRTQDSRELIRSVLKGPKIVCFFANILGENTCTIDGHARNIAYGERLSLSGSKFTIGKAEYKKLQECYEDAGVCVGLKAYEVQAITWVTWRRVHGI